LTPLSTHLKEDPVLLADLHNLLPPHERMQIDLVEDGQLYALIHKLLDMLDAVVADSDALDESGLFGLDTACPTALPHVWTADGRVKEIQVNVVQRRRAK
jgi:hypothetical protein